MTARKRVVEEACWLLSIMASNSLTQGVLSARRQCNEHKLATPIEDADPAILLVNAAWRKAALSPNSRNEYGTQDWHAQAAEAECLLRTGALSLEGSEEK